MPRQPKQYGGNRHGRTRRESDRETNLGTDREREEQGRQTMHGGGARQSRGASVGRTSEADIWENEQEIHRGDSDSDDIGRNG